MTAAESCMARTGALPMPAVQRSALPAVFDDAINDAIQPLPRAMQLANGREGDFLQQLGEGRERQMEKTEGLADGFDNFVGVAFHIGIEKRFAGDGQSEPRHLLMN